MARFKLNNLIWYGGIAAGGIWLYKSGKLADLGNLFGGGPPAAPAGPNGSPPLPPSPGNLLTANPGLESWVGNTPVDWRTWSYGATVSIEPIESAAEGRLSGRVRVAGGLGMVQSPGSPPVDLSKPVSGSVKIYTETARGIDRFTLRLISEGETLGENNIPTTMASQPGWQTATVSWAGGVPRRGKVYLSIYAQAEELVFYVDDARVLATV